MEETSLRTKIENLGYLPLNIPVNNRESITIKCLDCSSIRKCSYKGLSKYPECRICRSAKILSLEKNFSIISKKVGQIEFECREGHRQTASHFALKRRKIACLICNPMNFSTKPESSYEEILAKRSLKAVDEIPKSVKRLFRVVCLKCGHEFSASYDSLRKSGCRDCHFISVREEGSKRRLSRALDSAARNGIVVTKVDGLEVNCKCKIGHTFTKNVLELKRSPSCPKCSHLGFRVKIEDAQALAKDRGFKLLSNKYEHSSKKLLFECTNGHIFETMWRVFQQDCGCPHCFQQRDSCKLLKKAEEAGFSILDFGYGKEDGKVKVICEEGHATVQKRSSFSKWMNCRKCRANKYEKEIFTWFQSLGIEPLVNEKILSKNMELDFYVEAKGIAIEFCGLYWHCDSIRKDRKYHLKKTEECLQKGIKLLTIFEDEWIYKKDQVLGFLESKLGLNTRIPARKTEVKEVDKLQAKEFLGSYHIQGYVPSKKCYGLFFEQRLLMLASLSEHHRQNSKDVVLNRVCTVRGVTVIGGLSKLIKHLGENQKRIVTFADRRWSEGDSYLKAGFKIDKILPPDYSYFKGNRRFSKQSLKKTKNEKFYAKTEAQLRRDQGYRRIWDCGKVRLVLEK